jgi:hypothetical protein
VTAQDLLSLYGSPVAKPVDRQAVASHLGGRILFGEVQGQTLSPADMMLALLGVEPQVVDGPTKSGTTTYAKPAIPAAAFRKAVADTADFVRKFKRLPNEVFVGAERLSLADFAATLAGGFNARGEVQVARGHIEFDRYFGTDGRKCFDWIIHPEGFDGAPLLELGRLQGWTLKPARLTRQ